MIRASLFISLFFIVSPVIGQENCFDGVDNDGDGFVDLNDPEGCECQGSGSVELVINGNFESFDVCPNGFSQLPAATGYYISQGGSTDYYNSCGYIGGGLYPEVNDLMGGENGNGIAGFFSDPPAVGNYREYISTCLSSPLVPGQTYTLSFQLATTGGFSGGGMGGIEFSNCTTLPFGIFGSGSCPNDIGTDYNGCISEQSADYINILEADCEVLVNEWSTYSFDFTVSETLTNIVIGGGCSEPICSGPGVNAYFYMDNLSITGINQGGVNTPIIDVSGNSCQGYSFVVANPPFDSYQWFVNGIAVEDANSFSFELPADSTPTVGLGVTAENNQNITVCAFASPVNLVPEPEIELDVAFPEILCPGETSEIVLNISPPGDYSIEWSTGESGESITAEIGSYEVIVTNNQTGCNKSLIFEIQNCEDVLIDLELENQEICLGEEAIIEAVIEGGTPPYTYSWNPPLGNSSGPFNISPESNITYSLIVTDAAGETAEGSASITVINPENFEFSLGPDTALCRDETVVLSPVPIIENGVYTWNTGTFEPEIVVTEPGNYILTLETACGNFQDEVNIGQRNDPVFPVIPSRQLLCEDSSRTLSIPQNEGFIAFWENGAPASERTFSDEGVYSITFISECRQETRAFTVQEVDCECEIYVPNAFSPNGDGVNDVFKVSIECIPESYILRIFNRWGIEVFQSNDPAESWLGDNQSGAYHNGPTIYNYLLEVQPQSPIFVAEPIKIRGSITAIR